MHIPVEASKRMKVQASFPRTKYGMGLSSLGNGAGSGNPMLLSSMQSFKSLQEANQIWEPLLQLQRLCRHSAHGHG